HSVLGELQSMTYEYSVRRGLRRVCAGAVATAVAGGMLALVQTAAAQQNVPFRGGIPVAPSGVADKPLPPGPYEYATAEGQDIRVVVLTKDLEYPYGLAVLPDGTLL